MSVDLKLFHLHYRKAKYTKALNGKIDQGGLAPQTGPG